MDLGLPPRRRELLEEAEPVVLPEQRPGVSRRDRETVHRDPSPAKVALQVPEQRQVRQAPQHLRRRQDPGAPVGDTRRQDHPQDPPKPRRDAAVALVSEPPPGSPVATPAKEH